MRQSVSVARTSAVVAVSGGSSSPGSSIPSVSCSSLRVSWPSASDPDYGGGKNADTWRSGAGRNKGGGFSDFLSTKVVPAGFILVGVAILASGIVDLEHSEEMGHARGCRRTFVRARFDFSASAHPSGNRRYERRSLWVPLCTFRGGA